MDGINILIVEDDFLNRRLSRKILGESGYNVHEAKNASEAFGVLAHEDINLVILDINLGEEEENGISLGQRIKDKYNIPLIYLTAYESPEIIKQAIGTTPHSYLTKPFKNVDLLTSVAIAIRQPVIQQASKHSILVKDGEYNVKLQTDEIIYIESSKNYLLIHTALKTYRFRSTIKQIIESVPGSALVQTHRAFIVNKNKIEKFNAKYVVISGNIIPVSQNYLDSL